MDNPVGLATLIAAIAAAVVSIINALRTPAKIEEVKKEVTTVHHVINSRMTELLATTRRAAHAEGVVEGIAIPPPQKG